jgi:hypothetical protein
MNPKPFPPEALRAAIFDSVPAQTSQFGSELLAPQFLYLPRAYGRALHLDNMLVQGIRGAGKSLWWAALQSEPHRKRLASVVGRGMIDGDTRVSPGFGLVPNPGCYPGTESFPRLLANHEPRRIWQAVVLHLLLDKDAEASLGCTWDDRIHRIEAHPDEVSEKLSRVDHELRGQGRKHLLIFDALDRTANTWTDLRRVLKGLLEVLLDLRGYRAIRAKVFIRPDMLLAPEVTNFPDASKILANEARLSWSRADLFGLLWQHLANAERGGEFLRWECAFRFKKSFQRVGDVWVMPDELRRDEEMQRDLFHSITGPYMGEGPQRGFPYLWLPNRLADTHGQVSPRSFLAAVRAAAEAEFHLGDYPLHYEAIKVGVQAASRVRVAEICDDHPWVHIVMKPLRGLMVPCEIDEVVNRWDDERTLAILAAGPERTQPSRLQEGCPGLCKELVDLGIFELMGDGRINMPDVYRVGFSLRRRGGVRPVR